MSAHSEKLLLGVVVECRRVDERWRSEAWRACGLAPAPEEETWRLLRDDGQTRTFLAGPFTLELHRADADGYRYNLSAANPSLFVVLRAHEAGGMRPHLVTASPEEAQTHMESGDELVDALPIPVELQGMIQQFCARFPPMDFKKRKRDGKQGEAN
jgi:hypothetical protein